MDIERVVAKRLMDATGIKCVPDGTYRWDDPDTGTPRYQTNINLTICE